MKTGEWAFLRIGESIEIILKNLPATGLLFPKIATLSDNDRAAEFARRCRLLGIQGISLHSYRYAWAERARVAGYPERYAQAALGHKSSAVHHAYARNAEVICPPMENIGSKIIPFTQAKVTEAETERKTA
jgi:integrase